MKQTFVLNSLTADLQTNQQANKQFTFAQLYPYRQLKQLRKSLSPQQHCQTNQMLNLSLMKGKNGKRTCSPSISAVTSHNDDYYKDMERSLLGENMNLKQHNNFLVSQIKRLHERQRKYKKTLINNKNIIFELNSVVDYLRSQLQTLTGSIIAEIERMQKLIQCESSKCEDELMLSSNSESIKSQEGLGWQTEATLNHNLQHLKIQVNSIMYNNSKKKQRPLCLPTQKIDICLKQQRNTSKQTYALTTATALRNRKSNHSEINTDLSSFPQDNYIISNVNQSANPFK